MEAGPFAFLAEALGEIYDRVAPAAVDEMKAKGAEFGREQARKQFGDGGFRLSTRSGDDIDAFNASLAQTESGGNYQARNSSGYSGKYQFGQARLDDYNRANGTNYKTSDLVAGTPEAAQITEDVQRWHVMDIDADLGGYVGREVNGQTLSMNAIRAMAHLGGKGGARKYIETGGAFNPADSNGTTLSDYAARHGGQMRLSTRSEPGDGPTTVRNADGRLEVRRYSPYSGPILRAHDAAAKVAYQAEVMNKGSIDLMEMSNQFLLDPDGFASAAESYIDNIVDKAPEEMRADLYDVLGTEAHRRRLGIMGDKQRDIRARADNSSRALVDRWTDSYAEALVGGDPEEIAAAQRRLDSILQAREALPGVAWTEEQSANVFIRAEKLAEQLSERGRKERGAGYKDTFSLIIDAAKAGRTAKGEDIFDNPEAVAMYPELAREAEIFAGIRDTMPEILQMTPAEMDAAVAALMAPEVGAEFELDVVDAMRTLAKENRKAWEDDPVKRAAEVFPDAPPPTFEGLSLEAPDKFVTAMSERRDYMNGVREKGYTDTYAFLSDDEAESMALLMGKETPSEIRAAMSAAIVAGFGPDAVGVFNEIKGDPVTMFAGKMAALGGRPDVAAQMLEGQRLLEENLVQLPPNSDQIAAFDGQIASAFEGIPDAVSAQAEIMEGAKAIYATMARGVVPNSDAASDLMAQAVQIAMGQTTNKRGKKTGGVQPVMGRQTLLPMGMNGDDVDAKLRMAMGGEPAAGSFIGDLLTPIPHGMFRAQVDTAAIWEEAGASAPMFNGKPIPQRYVNDDAIRIIAVGGNLYRMEIGNGEARWPVEDADGNVLFFDLPKLMEAME